MEDEIDPLDKALGDAISGVMDPGTTTDTGVTPAAAAETTATPGETKEPVAATTDAPGETPPVADGRERDDQGRFKTKDPNAKPAPATAAAAKPPVAAAATPGTAAEPPKPGAVDPAAPPAAAAQPEIVDGRDITKPPSTWKGAAGIDFDKLPRATREEIHRREESMFKGIEGYKKAATFGNDMASLFRPYQKMLELTKLAPNDVVNAGLNFEYQMRTGSPEQKRTIIENLAKSYGVELVPAQPRLDEQGRPIEASPEIVSLRQTVQALQQQLEQVTGHLTTQQRAQQEEAQRDEEEQRNDVRTEIAKFAADPANEFYSEVREDMLGYIQSRRATGLKDAYDKAIWANPMTRAKLIARQQEAERKQAAEAAAAANKANLVNVTPRATPPGKTAGKGTLENVLSGEVDRALARSA